LKSTRSSGASTRLSHRSSPPLAYLAFNDRDDKAAPKLCDKGHDLGEPQVGAQVPVVIEGKQSVFAAAARPFRDGLMADKNLPPETRIEIKQSSFRAGIFGRPAGQPASRRRCAIF
jgi:hypothetical protein